MKWSWKVGQLAGIDFRIHATFLLLIGWVGASYWAAGKGMNAMLAGTGFIVALFACVVLHELGHAIMGRKFGVRTRDITLLPIGGVARLERIPEEPERELWIAVAGPAVNLAIAAVLSAWLTLTHEWETFSHLRVAAGPFVERLLVANISLVLFNLIPAFPMDGGRVLRALLAMRMPYPQATQTAASVGQGLAVVFVITGLFTTPMLLLVGLFVWIGASQEAGAARVRSALAGTPVVSAMLTDFDAVQSGDTLVEAARLTLQGSQRDFPVVDRGRVIGMLTGADLLTALTDHGQDYFVMLAMHRDFPVVESSEMLETAFQRLQDCGCQTMPVVHNDQLVGLITLDNLAEYLLIQSTLQKGGPRSRFMNRTVWRGAKPQALAGPGPVSSEAPGRLRAL